MNSKIQSLLKVAHLLLSKWKQIFIFCFIVVSLSIGYIMSIPRSYQSDVVMLPEIPSNNSLSSGLGSLASMAGVKLGNGDSEDAIYPEFYPKVVKTPDFLVALLNKPVRPKGLKQDVSLFIYLTQHQKAPWWDSLFQWGGLGSKEAPTNKIDPQRLTKAQEKLLKGLGASIVSFVDKRTNMVTINVTMQDPEVAAQVATMVENQLQQYIANYRTSKARNDVKYAERISQKALEDYKAAQKVYARFADANQDLVLTSVQQEETRLENEMQLAYNGYSQSITQLQLAQAKVQERMPAFTVLQQANVPIKPSAPKRMIFVFMMAVLSFSLSCLWIIIKSAMRDQPEMQLLETKSEKP